MIRDEVEQLIKPSIEDMGYELWGCEYLIQGRYSLLRIYIDKEDGIGIADCEKVSRQVSALLDVEDPIQGNYSLEVSSPGIPRPLFHAAHYARYIGKEVAIKVAKPVGGKRKLTGTLVSADENSLVLELDGTPQDILISNIVKANLTVE